MLGIGNLVGSDEAGTNWAESIEGLSATPLAAASVFLPVAGTDIIGAGVACDIVERFRGGNVFAITSDDDGEFAFVVDAIASEVTWEKDGIFWILERGDAFDEKNGVIGKFRAHFRGMPSVVESNGKNLNRSQGS